MVTVNGKKVDIASYLVKAGDVISIREVRKDNPVVKENMEAIECLGIERIPVDIGMLEVGQTYKVHIQKDWDHGFFTAKFLGFDEEDDYVVKFENNKPYTKFDIIEIYKVNK